MRRRLGLTTRTQISVCKSPFSIMVHDVHTRRRRQVLEYRDVHVIV